MEDTIKNNKSKVIHISHTDSDGYGCQYISHQFFQNIKFFNMDYTSTLSLDIIRKIQENKDCNIIIISDISLENSEISYILKHSNNKIIWYIDHHFRSETFSSYNEEENFVFLHNREKSSTMILYDYLSNNYRYQFSNEAIRLAELIDVYDLNKIQSLDYPLSIILNDAVMAEWCNPFILSPNKNALYRILQLDTTIKGILNGLSPLEIDINLAENRTKFLNKILSKNADLYSLLAYLFFEGDIYNAKWKIEEKLSQDLFLREFNAERINYLEDMYSTLPNNFTITDSLIYKYKESPEGLNFLRTYHSINKKWFREMLLGNNIVILNQEDQMLFHSLCASIIREKDIGRKIICNTLEENRISIRTSGGISAHRIAKELFNGGGHEKEAGGSISPSLFSYESIIKELGAYI